MLNEKTSYKHTVHLLLVLILIVSCAKEREYEFLHKEDIYSKSTLDTSAKYLYVPSVNQISRLTDATLPYYLGEGKIVKVQFNEKSLDLVQLDSDERFRNKSVNQTPVLSLPIQHKAYRCRENELKECSNFEEENNEINWSQKDKFRPDFNNLKIKEINYMPLDFDKIFRRCYQEIGSRVIEHKIAKDQLFVRVEKEYQAGIDCSESLKSLSELNFKVEHTYTLKKLDALVSDDYEVVNYPSHDQGKFGFFSTERLKMTTDYHYEESGRISFLNRWNPKRKEIKYYLSEEFFKEENKYLIDVTREAIQRINDGLKTIHSDMRIVLSDLPASPLEMADISNNLIVLFDDPALMGPIGYGPTITNPETGEIVHARVIMYLGSIIQYVRRAYDELLDEALHKMIAKKDRLNLNLKNGDDRVSLKYKVDPHHLRPIESKTDSQGPKLSDEEMSKIKDVINKEISPIRHSDKIQRLGHQLAHSMNGDATSIISKIEDEGSLYQSKLDFFSRNNTYHGDLINFNQIVASSFSFLDLGTEVPKPWISLSDKERQQIIKKIVPLVWLPTLIHELGHNLGLRHNFNGSEDKTNFFNSKQLKKMGSIRDIPYSSVMDYAYSSFNELTSLGNYDIAALLFGYKREIIGLEGQANYDMFGNVQGLLSPKPVLLPIQGTLENTFQIIENHNLENSDTAFIARPFMYCTDEHVSSNPGCNRHDQGVTNVEIVKHYIKSYHEQYERKNFRRGRENFSSMDDHYYIGRLHHIFSSLRNFFERYDDLRSNAQIPPQAWAQDKYLLDLKDAAVMAGEFFINIIQTPDVYCLLAEENDLDTIVEIRKLHKDSISCFDYGPLETTDGLISVGEIGRNFNSKKSLDSSSSYLDQIDVRGIQFDKLLAVHFLFAKRLKNPAIDKLANNFFVLQELQYDMSLLAGGFATDEVQAYNIPVFNPDFDGKYVLEFTYNPKTEQIVQPSLSSIANRMLGLGHKKLYFRDYLVSNMIAHMKDGLPSIADQKFINQFLVHRQVEEGRKIEEYNVFDSGPYGKFYALKGVHIVADYIINYIQWSRAIRTIPSAKIILELENRQLEADGIVMISGDDTSSDNELSKMSTDFLKAHVNHYLSSEHDLIDMLRSLKVE